MGKFIGIVLLLVAGGAVLFFLGINMLVWNINDVITQGANFWNVLWISIVIIVFARGGASLTFDRRH